MENFKEKILNKIRKEGRNLMIAGIVLAVLFLGIVAILTFMFIMAGINEGFGEAASEGVPVFILEGILLVFGMLGILMIAKGRKKMKNPQDAKVLKANPDLLFMANELSQGLNYQDDYFLMSDRVVANKKNLYQMAFYNEIFMVYVYTASTNGITTTKQLVLATARDEITIGIYGKKEEQVNAMARTIAEKCPYARFGYNQENLRYLEEMRKVWQRAKLDQKMGISQKQVEKEAQKREQAIATGQQTYYDPDSTIK